MRNSSWPIGTSVFLWAAIAGTVVQPGGLSVARAETQLGTNSPTPLRITRGKQITLPIEGVTRVLKEDDDVVRTSFNKGRAIIEGVTVGSTTIAVYHGNNKKQLYAVEVASDTGATPGVTNAVSEAAAAAPVEASPSAVAAAAVPAAAAPAAESSTPAVLPAPAGSASVTEQPGAVSSPLSISLRVAPAEDNPNQAVVTLTYGNNGADAANVQVHYVLDDLVSYVTGSATGNPTYDAASRELVWKIDSLPSNTLGQTLSFRVEPVDRTPVTFYSAATIEDASGVAVSSNQVKYSTVTTPLLTVFALPDRLLAGRNQPVLVDVNGLEFQAAVDRLQKIGIIDGREQGRFYPNLPTQRAEYTVMTLKGLNLRDLRDVTAIKFVLGRASVVNLNILNSKGQVVAPLLKNQQYNPGERTVLWDGRSGSGYCPPGRYTYVCTAKDSQGETTTLKGIITIVPQSPLEPGGKPSFTDVKPSDWYSGYLSIAEKQDLIKGYPGKLFRPQRPISRVEATAMVVRALGLEDLARQAGSQDVGFLDYQDIPRWGIGYVNVASTLAKTASGKLIVGYPSNMYKPNKALRRDEAALIVQRLIDKETNRRVTVSGQLAPGAIVTINNRTVESADDGQFSFIIEQNSAEPITVAVVR